MKHLDEGTIHAWLDGALSAGEAAEVERHADECAECAARVKEARGLLAASSRILAALDDTPAGVEPKAEARRPRRRWMRVTQLAIAATLMLAVGLEVRSRTSSEQSPSVAPRPAAAVNMQAVGSSASVAAAAVPQAAAKKAPEVAAQKATPKPALKTPPANSATPVEPKALILKGAVPTPPGALASGTKGAGSNAAAGVGAGSGAAALSQEVQVQARAQALHPVNAEPAAVVQPADRVAGLLRAELATGPVCFAPTSAMNAMRETTIRAQSEAKAMFAAPVMHDVQTAGTVRTMAAQLPGNVLMLDSTPVSRTGMVGPAPRLLIDSTGVIGEWTHVGSDSLVLRFAQPTHVIRGVLTVAGLRVGTEVMRRTACKKP